MRDSTPTAQFPWVTGALIVINVVAYVLTARHGGSLISGPDDHEVLRYGVTPAAITHGHRPPHALPAWATVFTAMFLHASILHLAGNLLFLWVFGATLESSLGRLRYLLFYLVAGLVALALQVAVDPGSSGPVIGASGAIAGVLGGYIVLYPRGQVLTLVFIVLFVTVIELPALVLLVVWFAEQVVFAATHLITPMGGGAAVPYLASVGGFAFGVLTARLLAGRRRAPAA